MDFLPSGMWLVITTFGGHSVVFLQIRKSKKYIFYYVWLSLSGFLEFLKIYFLLRLVVSQ
jgi:hypothetical protein